MNIEQERQELFRMLDRAHDGLSVLTDYLNSDAVAADGVVEAISYITDFISRFMTWRAAKLAGIEQVAAAIQAAGYTDVRVEPLFHGSDTIRVSFASPSGAQYRFVGTRNEVRDFVRKFTGDV